MGKIKLGLLLLLMTLVGTPMTGYGMQLSESELYARSACLMDADSGRVLYSKNSEQKLPMASTTKIMTCILALEDGRMDDLVTVSAYAASQPKVHMGAKMGSTVQRQKIWQEFFDTASWSLRKKRNFLQLRRCLPIHSGIIVRRRFINAPIIMRFLE